MATGAFCGVAPFFFRRKIPGFEGKAVPHANKSNNASNNMKAMKGSPVRKSCEVAGSFLVNMEEFKNKISTFRDLLDLPPCVGSASVNELLTWTLKDLFKLYPRVQSNITVSELEGASIHQGLKFFCDALKSLGNLWKNSGEWMVNCKYDASIKLDQIRLEQIALAMLEEMIKLARERLFDIMDDDDEDMRDYSSPTNAFGKAFSKSYSDNKNSLCSSPATPTSVLPEMRKFSSKGEKMSYSPPRLSSLRVQAVEKLNPIDLKRLSLHMFHHTDAQDLKCSIQVRTDEQQQELQEKWHSEGEEGDVIEVNQDFEMLDDMGKIDEISQECEMKDDVTKILVTNSTGVTGSKGRNGLGSPHIELVVVPDTLTNEDIKMVSPPPSSNLQSNDAEPEGTSLTSPPMSPPNAVTYQISEPAPLPPPQSTSPDKKESIPVAQSPPPSPNLQSNDAEPEGTSLSSPPMSPPNAVMYQIPEPPPLPPPQSTSPDRKESIPMAHSPPPLPPLSPITSKSKVLSAPPPPQTLSPIMSKSRAMSAPPPPLPSPPTLMTSRNTAAILTPSPQVILGNMETPPPPPPLPVMSKNLASPPPPPPPPPMSLKNGAPPPLPPLASKNGAPLPPPPPMLTLKGAVPLTGVAPPPPLGLAGAKNLLPKKATTKLRRSSQMGNLYRLLKGGKMNLLKCSGRPFSLHSEFTPLLVDTTTVLTSWWAPLNQRN